MKHHLETNGGDVETKQYNCGKFQRIKGGILKIGNHSLATIRKRRSSHFYTRANKSGKDSTHFDGLVELEQDYHIILNDTNSIFTLIGHKVVIPCYDKLGKSLKNIKDDELLLLWEYKVDEDANVKHLSDHGKYLQIDNVETKHSGHYFCTVKTKENSLIKEEKFSHELQVVILPICKLKLNIFYSTKNACNLNDADLLHNYLPNLVKTLLCSGDNNICIVDIERPICVQIEDISIYNVTIVTNLKQFDLNGKLCDINCMLKIQTNLLRALYKNIQSLEKLPLNINVDGNQLEFKSKFNNDVPIQYITKGPQILPSCPAGFGIEKDSHRICSKCSSFCYCLYFITYLK